MRKNTIYTLHVTTFSFSFPFGTLAFSTRLQMQQSSTSMSFLLHLFLHVQVIYTSKHQKSFLKQSLGKTRVVHLRLADLCSDEILLKQSDNYDSSQKVLKVLNYRETFILYLLGYDHFRGKQANGTEY